METRDIIYTIGISATLIISLVALFINIRNRRNGMREHLYKEQMAFFVSLSRELHLVSEYYLTILREGVLSQEVDEQLEIVYDRIDTMGEAHDFITPEEISDYLSDVIKIGGYLHLKSMEESITDKDMRSFDNALLNLTDAMREHMGVDKLSHENRRLSFGRARLSSGVMDLKEETK